MDPESGPLLDCLVFVHPADLPHNQYGFTKVTKEAGFLQPIASPSIPFHTIAMDFMSGIPEAPAEHTPCS